LYPINKDIKDNGLYNSLFNLLTSPLYFDDQMTFQYIADVLTYYLVYYSTNIKIRARFVQVTKTLMDDIIITIFTNDGEFIGGWFLNETIETLNIPVIFDGRNHALNLEYLKIMRTNNK
jgi:hypothetical protein